MTASKTISVRKEILVEASQAHAFNVFTERFDSWWPREHKIGPAALKTAVIEPGVGGRWYEIDDDGSECNWGKVLVWDPPQRLVLAWQITGEWKFDNDFVTEVEVQFHAEGPSTTRVTVEHKNIERFGEFADSTSQAFDSESGWSGLLKLFAESARE